MAAAAICTGPCGRLLVSILVAAICPKVAQAMPGVDPRAVQMAQQQVMLPTPQNMVSKETTKKKLPFDLTVEQFDALVVLVAAGISVSKPIQEKLASSVPKFLNAQVNRSLVGLASTGTVAAIIFYVARKYF